jgi:mannonate dehydratase
MTFKESWRWYGPHDPIKLSYIKQAGATGIVTALHQIPVGDIWSKDEIKARLDLLAKENDENITLDWVVVESLPVHEDIKQGKDNRDVLIANYKESIRNLASCGVKTICYNFMPVLDWLRTNVSKTMIDGSKALHFDPLDLIIFDIFILKRDNANLSYPEKDILLAKKKYASMPASDLKILEESILMALPGDTKGFTLEKLQKGIAAYAQIDTNKLRDNLVYFLQQVIPVAEEEGVFLAIHPDDPPWSVFGLPRIVGKKEDLDFIFNKVPSNHNGFTFCSGSLGAHPDNNLVELIKKYADRIHFVHLRSTQRNTDGSFYEANHLEGNANLIQLIKEFKQIGDSRIKNGLEPLPMRPDHGHQMLNDLNSEFYPGYSAIGRLRGLAELRGATAAIEALL